MFLRSAVSVAIFTASAAPAVAQLSRADLQGIVDAQRAAGNAQDDPRRRFGRGMPNGQPETVNVAGAVDRDSALAQSLLDRLPAVAPKKRRSKKPAPAPVFRVPDLAIPLHEGDVGPLPGSSLEILQITGPSSARARLLDGDSHQDVYVKSFDVSHFVDRHTYSLANCFLVTAPKRYKTVLGGSRTVM